MSYLPHIYPTGATFFITFRLADSLPQQAVNSLKSEFKIEKNTIQALAISADEKSQRIQKLRKEIFGIYDKQLDKAQYGDCYMHDSAVAQILWDKIFQYNKRYYTVDALSIMPNHVHMLLDTSIQVDADTDIDEVADGYVEVNKWMQLIKGGSSFLINKHLNRSGVLWAKESYDHYVRYHEAGEYEQIKTYIELNPVKAGLEDKFLIPPYRF